MRTFIFESSIDQWAGQTSFLHERIALWKEANINTILLLVDDWGGATWPSMLVKQHPAAHLASEPLRRTVDLLHEEGFSVIFVFDLINYNPYSPIHPEWKITGTRTPYYDVWNEDFTTWRAQYINECVAYCAPDAIVIDYCRSGRPAITEPVSADVAVKSALAKIKGTLTQSLPIGVAVDSLHALPNQQGIDIVDWHQSKIVDYAVVFNYSPSFPYQHIAHLTMPLWLCAGTYAKDGSTLVNKPGIEVARIARSIIHQAKPAAYGLYLAKMFTAEHATAMKNLQFQIKI
ncbi:MAG: hypothetical protein ACRCZI_06640 [Cetobacterium sp.]